MKTIPLHGVSEKPDYGKLKKDGQEYELLQNVKGLGQRIFKRRGMVTAANLTSGIMGIFDLKIDDDPTSPNKIAVWTYGGDLVLYDFSELTTIFDFLIETGQFLYLQSPDLNWWAGSPDSSGILIWTVVVAPPTIQSADFNVAVGQLFGFEDSSGEWRMFSEKVELDLSRYGPATSVTFYSTGLAIATGFGIVFEETNLNRVRYTMDNSGIITATVIA